MYLLKTSHRISNFAVFLNPRMKHCSWTPIDNWLIKANQISVISLFIYKFAFIRLFKKFTTNNIIKYTKIEWIWKNFGWVDIEGIAYSRISLKQTLANTSIRQKEMVPLLEIFHYGTKFFTLSPSFSNQQKRITMHLLTTKSFALFYIPSNTSAPTPLMSSYRNKPQTAQSSHEWIVWLHLWLFLLLLLLWLLKIKKIMNM